MAIEDLKPYEFTSTNQPDPAKKRVPKLKTRMKKIALENIEEFIKKVKEGNPKFWEMCLDRGFGKVKQGVDLTTNGESIKTDLDLIDEIVAKQIDDNKNDKDNKQTDNLTSDKSVL